MESPGKPVGIESRLLLGLMLVVGNAWAQTFQSVTGLDEFPQVTITALVQDHQGFVWLGTQAGLVRHDGYGVKVFRAGAGSSTLPGPTIRDLDVASDGRVWVATNRGLAVYDSPRETFGVVPGTEGADVVDLDHHAGSLGVLLADGVVLFVTSEGQIERRLTMGEPATAVKLTDEFILIGSRNGVVAATPAGKVRARLLHERAVKTLYAARDGRIWVGLEDGLAIVDPSQSLQFADLPAVLQELGNSVEAIVEDRDGGVWLASDNERALLRVAPDQRSVRPFRHQLVRHGRALLEDFTGTLWIGSLSGAATLSRQARAFGHAQPGRWTARSGERIVTAVFEDSEATLWAGVFGAALVRLNDVTGEWVEVNGELRQVIAIAEATPGHLWVGTDKGLQVLDKSTGQARREWRGLDLPQRPALDIRAGFDGATWFNLDGELVWWGGEQFCPVPLGKVEHLLPLRSGEVWVVARDQTNYRLRVDSTAICSLPIVERVSMSDIVEPLLEASDGSVWMGTDQGLARWSEDAGLFYVDTTSGIHPDVIYGAQEAADGHLWLGTADGLVQLISDTEYRRYRALDGVGQREFNGEASLRRRDGRLVFGGMEGLNHFNPDLLDSPSIPPRIGMTSLSALHRDGTTSALPLTTLPALISLEGSARGISADFVGLHFAAPHRNQHRYRLVGYDQQWQRGRLIRYTDLPAGNYTLEVAAANPQGIWSDTMAVARIQVHTPWQTPAAYAAYLLLGALLAYLLMQARNRMLRQRNEQLAALVRQRTADLQDQTDRVAAQNEELKSLDQAKERFFENISHEFRTPLTLILGPLRRMRGEVSGDLHQQLDVPIRNASRLLRLINQFLDLARLGHGANQRPMGRHNLSEQVRATVRLFAEAFRHKGVQLKLNVEQEILMVYDAVGMEDVLANLLSNALKFTDQGQVGVSVRRDGDEAVIGVEDTGPGIPAEELPHVFDRFHQARDDHNQGSGVGLTLVKELVEAHAGTVTVNSTPGQGTQFVVRLPTTLPETAAPEEHSTMLADELPTSEVSPAGASCSVSGSGADNTDRTVLIVDDDSDMRQYLAEVLKEYQLIVGADGEEGLTLARAHVPDLVVADVMMPKLSGLELAEALRHHHETSHIPIVLLTARGGRSSKLKGLRQGVDDYIVKPFDEDELKLRINNILEIRDLMARRLGQADPLDGGGQVGGAATDAFQHEVNEVLSERGLASDFAPHELAVALNLSDRQLQRKMRAVIDQSPSEYIRNYRLATAAKMLCDGQPVTETAYAVGFVSVPHFSRCFRAQYNLSPRAYANQSGTSPRKSDGGGQQTVADG